MADLFGLCLAAGRMGAHVQPNLQDVSNWNAVADDCGAEDGFRDLGEAPGMARVEANLFVSAWQGAIVVARAGEGLEHIGRVFRYLQEIVPLSC
ncbi:MAG TPA: hypothetical protein VGG56_17535 [Terracidiphilus sp.]